MFNIGGGEMVVIGVVALIVVGPKDLPNMFRKTGQFVGRMRGLADDFRRTMESAADDVGVKQMKADFDEMGRDAQDFTKFNDINENVADIEPDLKTDLKPKKTPVKKSTKKTAVKAKVVKKTKAPDAKAKTVKKANK